MSASSRSSASSELTSPPGRRALGVRGPSLPGGEVLLLGELEERLSQGDDHRPEEEPDEAEGGEPSDRPHESRERVDLGAAGDQERTQQVVRAPDQGDAPDEQEDRLPPDAERGEIEDRGSHHQGRPDDRHEGCDGRQRSEDHGRRQAHDREARRHGHSLGERRHDVPREDGARDVSEAAGEPLLSAGGHGHEPQQATRHRIAVPEEEEEKEEHQQDPRHQAEGAGHGGAAAREHPRHDVAQGVHEPGLDPRRIEPESFLREGDRPPHDRNVDQVLEPGDLVSGGRSRQAVHEVDRLIEEGSGEENGRKHDAEEHEDGQEGRREPVAAGEPGPQPAVRREQHEREERRPDAGREERIHHPEKEIAERGQCREAEDARIEAVR